jgi:hypothetical protein
LIPSNSLDFTIVNVRTETSEEIDCKSNKPMTGNKYSWNVIDMQMSTLTTKFGSPHRKFQICQLFKSSS